MAPFKVGSVDVKLSGAFKHKVPLLDPKTTELPAGHKKQPTYRSLPTTIVFDRDQSLTLRDGTKIFADVFRPKTEQKVPAIVMWGPYGKTGAGLLNIY